MFSNNNKGLLLIITGFILVGLIFLSIFYANLGGDTSIEIEQASLQDSVVVYGKKFQGAYNDPEMEKLFFQMKKLAASDSIKGYLTIVSYLDEIDDDNVSYFVGVSSNESDYNWTGRSFDSVSFFINEVLHVKLNMHNSVMPLPEEVQVEMESYAKENNLEISDYTLEQYVNERELIISRPIVNQ